MRALFLLTLLPGLGAAAEEHFNKRVAVLEEFPREVARGKKQVLKGTRMGDYEGPRLIAIGPNGRTYLCDKAEIGQYKFEIEMEFKEGAGPYRFELYLTSGARGAVSAARFTVWYGQRRPEAAVEEAPPDDTPTPLALHPRLVSKRFFRRLNELRRSIRVDEVGWNEAVAARERDHAWRMARAKRRVHKFGGWGVREMLRRDGAGEWAPWSGPDEGWNNVAAGPQPFPRQALEAPGPRVYNRVLQYITAGTSLNLLFEKYYVREAAHRLMATDPNCIEVGIGCAREEKGDPNKVYLCICFVQVNEKPLYEKQERAFRQVRSDAAGMDPDAIRRLGYWSRPKPSASIVRKALREDDAGVRGAGLDAWLLIDEEEARKAVAEMESEAAREMESGDAEDAWRIYRTFAHVAYDARITRAGRAGMKSIADRLRAWIAQVPEEKRADAEADAARKFPGLELGPKKG